MAEVYAWPDGRLWIFSADAVTPAAIAFAERVSMLVDYDWRRYKNLSTGAWDQRVTEVLSDKTVNVNVGLMWADNNWLLRSRSATAWNVAYSAESPIDTASWMVWTAVITKVQFMGQDGALSRFSMAFRAPEFSAV